MNTREIILKESKNKSHCLIVNGINNPIKFYSYSIYDKNECEYSEKKCSANGWTLLEYIKGVGLPKKAIATATKTIEFYENS